MKKKFDAVQLQRDIREKLGKEYDKDSTLRKKRLAAIHKRYGLPTPKKRPVTTVEFSRLKKAS